MRVLRPTDRVELAAQAVSAAVDGEIVALNASSGVCFGLDAIGSRVWSLIQQPTTIEDICAVLGREYDVSADVCLTDVTDLLQQLLAEGLAVVRSGDVPAGT